MKWTTAQDMFLITTAGIPTHRDGNVLDLEWNNMTAVASVSSEYNCTSDHETVAGSLQVTRISNSSRITPELRVRDHHLEIFSYFIKVWLRPSSISNVIDVEMICQI